MHLDHQRIMQVEFLDPTGERRRSTHMTDWPVVDEDDLNARISAFHTFYASLGCQVLTMTKLEFFPSKALHHSKRPTRLARVK